MTRIIALSDTHLENEILPPAVAALVSGADIILHAGDFVSARCHAAIATLGPALEAVHGNSDCMELKKLLPQRKVIEVEGVRIGLVHMASHRPGGGGDDGQGDGCAGFGLRTYPSTAHREGQAAAHLPGQHHTSQNVGAFCGRAGDRRRQCEGKYYSCRQPRLQLSQVRRGAGEKRLESILSSTILPNLYLLSPLPSFSSGM
jgi:hypothetical protein